MSCCTDALPWSSPTGCPPSVGPTGSWCCARARSSSQAAMTRSAPLVDITPTFTSCTSGTSQPTTTRPPSRALPTEPGASALERLDDVHQVQHALGHEPGEEGMELGCLGRLLLFEPGQGLAGEAVDLALDVGNHRGGPRDVGVEPEFPDEAGSTHGLETRR